MSVPSPSRPAPKKFKLPKLPHPTTCLEMPLILVEWVDATSHLDTGTFGELEKVTGLETMQDIGFFVCKRKGKQGVQEIVICSSRCPADGDFRWTHAIPVPWITGLEILQRSGG